MTDDLHYRRGYAGGWYDMMARAADIAAGLGLKHVEDRIRSIPRPVAAGERPVVSIMSMGLSDGRTDYFVSIKVGDKNITPHVFREEFKAAYHVALYDWLLNNIGEEPELLDFDEKDWPARKLNLWNDDFSKAPTEAYDYFLVRPKGTHPASGKPYLPTIVQRIEGQLYSTDNELEPLYFGEREPIDSPFRTELEWKPLPPDWR